MVYKYIWQEYCDLLSLSSGICCTWLYGTILSYYWLCSGFVYTSITTNTWVIWLLQYPKTIEHFQVYCNLVIASLHIMWSIWRRTWFIQHMTAIWMCWFSWHHSTARDIAQPQKKAAFKNYFILYKFYFRIVSKCTRQKMWVQFSYIFFPIFAC